MPRKALARFFERLVVASLPLAVSACGGSHAPPTTTSAAVDLSTSESTGDGLDGGTGAAGSDLAKGGSVAVGGLAGADMYDVCEASAGDPPPAVVPFPASDMPDGGFATPCQAGAFCNKYCPT